MLTCHKCRIELEKNSFNGNNYWECPSCGGRAVSMDVIGKLVPFAFLKELWQRESSSPQASGSYCPICNHKITSVIMDKGNGGEAVDVCRSCRFVWFDHIGFESLHTVPHKPLVDNTRPIDVRRALAMARMESVKSQFEYDGMANGAPDHWWQYILGFLGLPVASNAKEMSNFPLVTWSLTAIIVIVALITFPDLKTSIQNWALIPVDATRHYGLTFINSFFLHGGIIHLIGNVYFLLVFGRDAEDSLGIGRYLALVAVSAFAGDIAHMLIDPRSSMPLVGASGGISGILIYYCLTFPKAKIGFFWFFRFTWYRVPVGWFFFIWIIGQLMGAIKQVSGFESVSSLAHLGGVAVGLIFWYLTSRPEPIKETG